MDFCAETTNTLTLQQDAEATVSETLTLRVSDMSYSPFEVKETSDEFAKTIDASSGHIGRDSRATTSSSIPDQTLLSAPRDSIQSTLVFDEGKEMKTRQTANNRAAERQKRKERIQKAEKALLEIVSTQELCSKKLECMTTMVKIKSDRCMNKAKNRIKSSTLSSCRKATAMRANRVRLARTMGSILKRRRISEGLRLIETIVIRKKIKNFFVYFQRKNPKPPSGLHNIGNTCFMNAALNALYYTQPMHTFFRSLSGHVLTDLSQTFKLFIQHYETGADMTPLLYQIGRHLPEFGNGRQNCAHSFILKALAKLDKDLQCGSALCPAFVNSIYAGKFANYQKSKCKEMHEIFSGLMENVFTCSRCFGHWSNFSYFRTLDLPITDKADNQKEEQTAFFGPVDFFNERIAKQYIVPTEENVSNYTSMFREWFLRRGNRPVNPSIQPSNLDLCFEYTFRATLMTADNKFDCATCGIETQHFKQSFLRHTGKVLMIHFQRFNELTGGKLETYVRCPETLTLDKYLPGSGRYVLQSVINHYGSLSGGHYTAYVKVKGKWYECNDSFVREIDNSTDLFRAAYVVTYVKEE